MTIESRCTHWKKVICQTTIFARSEMTKQFHIINGLACFACNDDLVET
jgi:hypothetical protein